MCCVVSVCGELVNVLCGQCFVLWVCVVSVCVVSGCVFGECVFGECVWRVSSWLVCVVIVFR